MKIPVDLGIEKTFNGLDKCNEYNVKNKDYVQKGTQSRTEPRL
jgi:hypothetical protein